MTDSATEVIRTWPPAGDTHYAWADEELTDKVAGKVVGYTGGAARQLIEYITGEKVKGN